MKIFIFIEWALFHSQSLCYVIINIISHGLSFLINVSIFSVFVLFVMHFSAVLFHSSGCLG